jgi:hypothetical protein
MLTAGAQSSSPDDTVESDMRPLPKSHATALISHARSDDARVVDLPPRDAFRAEILASESAY